MQVDLLREKISRSWKCENMNAKITGPNEFKYLNDAWTNKNDSKSDDQVVRLLTDFSFNFTSRKWENGIQKYDHDDLKFISTIKTAGIERHSDLECHHNLIDIIGFVRGGYLDVENLKLMTIFRFWWRNPILNKLFSMIYREQHSTLFFKKSVNIGNSTSM